MPIDASASSAAARVLLEIADVEKDDAQHIAGYPVAEFRVGDAVRDSPDLFAKIGPWQIAGSAATSRTVIFSGALFGASAEDRGERRPLLVHQQLGHRVPRGHRGQLGDQRLAHAAGLPGVAPPAPAPPRN
jgi:hypothetical protein